MIVKTMGVILKHRNLGESDRVFTIMSEDYGIIEAVANNVNRLKNNPNASIIQFGYYELELYTGKERYFIKTVRLIEGFTNLYEDLSVVALAGYFCELTLMLTVPAQNAKEYLRLLLNTFHFLHTQKKPPELLKSIFELRTISIGGFQPNLVGCAKCHIYENENFRFYPIEASLLCPECYNLLDNKKDKGIFVTLTMSTLITLRHILYSELEKLFSISMADINLLNKITEQYVLLQTGQEYNSLNMYNQFKK